MALLGALVYFGLSVSTLFVSAIFQKFNVNLVLGFAMIGNAIACFVFSASSNKPILYAMRFTLGFTQAFCVVYSPVWINEFSPRKASTRWLAILHSFAVVGVMVGYVFGAIIINFFAKSLGWRFAFMI